MKKTVVLCLLFLFLSSLMGCGNILNIDIDEMKKFTLAAADYKNFMDCTYTVTGDGRDIELSFEKFDVENHGTCSWDYLEVKDSDGISKGKFCGTLNPGPFVSTEFSIIFKTDSSITKSGFTMAFAYDDPVAACEGFGGVCSSSCGQGKESIATCGSAQCCVNNPLPSSPVCGQVPKTSTGTYRSGARIVAGEEAEPHSWPWQVSLQDSSSHWCGGSLISDRWVVTAAHCVHSYSPGALKVRVGEHRTGKDTDSTIETTGIDFLLDKILVHEQYNDEKLAMPNDIALLKLTTAVEYGDTIQPVCVPDTGATFDNTTHGCWITGWGNTQGNEDKTILQELEVNIITNGECKRRWSPYSINAGHVCVFDARDGRAIGGACNGDSGGPLACQTLNNNGGSAPFWLVGVASWVVDGCTTSGYPAVYSRVSEFRDWIFKKMTTE